MRLFIAVAVALCCAACSPKRSHETPTEASAKPQPPVSFRQLFDLPTSSVITQLRLTTEAAPCTYGLQYLKEPYGQPSLNSVGFWGYVTDKSKTPSAICDPYSTQTTQTAPMFRATTAATNLDHQRLAIQIQLSQHPVEYQRYLELAGTLGAQADVEALSALMTSKKLFARLNAFVSSLGQRISRVELWRLEQPDPQGARTKVRVKVPALVYLHLENTQKPAPLAAERTNKTKSFGSAYGLDFPVSVDELIVKGGADKDCSVELTHRGHDFSFALPKGCEITKSHLTQDLPPLYNATVNLMGTAGAPVTHFGFWFSGNLKVMDKWATALKSKEWTKRSAKIGQRNEHDLMEMLMMKYQVFESYEPLFDAIGYRIKGVHLEKISYDQEKNHKHFPALKALGVRPNTIFPVPLMTHLELELKR